MRKTRINDNWLFKRCECVEEAVGFQEWDSTGFSKVCLPHDACISKVEDFYKDAVLFYKKEFSFNKSPEKNYVIYFEGAYMDMSLYVNGRHIGDWVNGFTSCFFDITDALTGNDEILVRLVLKNPNARWYTGGGINRNVWFYELPKTHICIDSLATKVDKEKLYISTEINNLLENDKVVFSIPDLNNEFEVEVVKKEGNTSIVQGCTTLTSIVLWDIDNPKLYELEVKILRDGIVIDSTSSRTGFRRLTIDAENGILLNGRSIRLKGVCLHSDSGALGSVFHKDMAYRQLNAMKAMGVNAIRTAHNVVAPEFLDACDELGLVVMDEIYDSWIRPKTTYDYARFFNEYAAKDVASFVRRDRTHPSVIMWSVGNEIYDTHADEKGKETLKYLRDLVIENDIYGHAYVTLASNYIAWENTQNCVEDIGLIGYNYTEKLYEEHHRLHPDWIIYGSETASIVASRGIYHFPMNQPILADDDLQCSSLGNSNTSWGAKSHSFCIQVQRDYVWNLGQFLWSGIDYLGEPTPYHTKNSYFGLCDTAVFEKDAYYLYQAEWTNASDNPMIHLLPYWDFNEGQEIDVRICSNAYKVELFKDGKSLGTKLIDHEKGDNFYADYKVIYEAGKLEAVAYDKAGNIIAKEAEESFGEVESLSLSESSFEVDEGEDRIFFVTITASDRDNRTVKNANRRVVVSVDGVGELVGLDNGDSTDMDSYKDNSRRMFSGKLLAMIKTTGQKGNISVHASLDEKDIPVRKVEIVAKDGNRFTKEKDTLEFEAISYPANANSHEIVWQITNDAGVEIKNATVISKSEDGHKVVLKGIADGDFRIRALAKEESGKIIYISNLELHADGLGSLFINPYEFVSGSLYTDNDGDVTSGNERGVATSRTEMVWVAFDNVDFGKNGSNQVTMPIFELDNTDTEFIFWKGTPYKEGSHICGRGIYNKPSIWNVYQEETFVLDEFLTGVNTFAMELHHKVHIKGFAFNKRQITDMTINAVDADLIYGDSFENNKDTIEKIGNNVSMVFQKLDFENGGIKGITITGRTPLDKNTIHIMFEKNGETIRHIVEFSKSDEYVNQSFEVNGIEGINDVTFLFLPGSNFDFKGFSFY